MNDFLARRHDAYTTRPDEIAAVVGKVTRQPIAGYEKRVRGYDNEVYVVTLHNGSRLVVRIRRHGELPLEDEAWAIEQARAAGAPVPTVYLCEHVAIDGAVRPFVASAEYRIDWSGLCSQGGKLSVPFHQPIHLSRDSRKTCVP